MSNYVTCTPTALFFIATRAGQGLSTCGNPVPLLLTYTDRPLSLSCRRSYYILTSPLDDSESSCHQLSPDLSAERYALQAVSGISKYNQHQLSAYLVHRDLERWMIRSYLNRRKERSHVPGQLSKGLNVRFRCRQVRTSVVGAEGPCRRRSNVKTMETNHPVTSSRKLQL